MKLILLVVYLVAVATESQTITVLDNTRQQSQIQDFSRRRPVLPMRDRPHEIQQQATEHQTVAETIRDEVKIKGFRTAVVHKPSVSSEGQAGGLTVQDPPKGWPFSEIHVNFNSHMSDDEPKSASELHPVENSIHNNFGQDPQLLLHQQQKQEQIRQHQQKLMIEQQEMQLRQQRMNHYNQIQNQQFIQQQQQQQQEAQHPHHVTRTQQNSVDHISQQQPYQATTTVQSSAAVPSNGLIHTIEGPTLVPLQPPPFRINNEHQQSGFVPSNGEEKVTSQFDENNSKLRRPNSSQNTGYSVGFSTPPDSFAHSNQKSNVFKNELLTTGKRLEGKNENRHHVLNNKAVGDFNNNQQSLSLQHNNNHHTPHVVHIKSNNNNEQSQPKATSSVNFKHIEGESGNSNYVWRDVSPGLQVSSNAPQTSSISHQNSVFGTQKLDQKVVNEVQENIRTEHSENNIVRGKNHYATGTHLHGHKYGHVQTFDHADAIGHSNNFGHRDAISPPGEQVNEGTSQVNSGHTDRPLSETQNSGRLTSSYSQGNVNQIHTHPHSLGKGVSKTTNIFPDIKKSPSVSTINGNIGHNKYITHNNNNQQQQHHQQQQQPQQSSPLSENNFGLDNSGQKTHLKLNKGLVPGITGSLVLGNGVHIGYASTNAGGQHNLILSPQGLLNSGSQGSPIQTLYIPISGLQNTQTNNIGNQYGQSGATSTQQQTIQAHQNVPNLITGQITSPNTISSVNQGVPNAGHYIILNGGVNGHPGVGGLPVLQGNLFGVQNLPGIVGGNSVQSAGTSFGGNPIALASGSAVNYVPQGNRHIPYHTNSQQQNSFIQTPQIQGTQLNPMATGKDLFNFNSFPHFNQQIYNQQSQIRPQLNTQGNGFGFKTQHPITQQNFKIGGQQKAHGTNLISQQLPFLNTQSNNLGIQTALPSTPTRGYQPLPPSPYQPILPTTNQNNGFKFHSPGVPQIQPSINIPPYFPISQGAVKRDENNQFADSQRFGIEPRDRISHGWSKNASPYRVSKSEKAYEYYTNPVYPSPEPYVIGMNPPE